MTGKLGISWRFALAAVQRRPAATVVQLVSLAVGLMALLLLTVTRTDLVNAWRSSAPPDAPNRFIVNIQPDQVDALSERLRGAGLDAPISPMVRGRLVEVNGRPVGPENYTGDRAQRLVDREFNLSYATDAPTHNRITAGRWFRDGSDELSIEVGIADTLGLTIGDAMTFDIAGQRVAARITSLRKVNWDSMRANFFVIMPPSLLADKPASFITAFHLPAGARRVVRGTAARVSEPHRDRHDRRVPAGAGGHRPGRRRRGVPVRIHARGRRARALRRAGIEPRRARARGRAAARAGSLAAATVAGAGGRNDLHRRSGRLPGGSRRERHRLGAGALRVRVRLRRVALGVRVRHRRRRAGGA